MRQPTDHLGTPTLFDLPRQNVAAELPVQAHQFLVDRQRRTLLGGVDAALQVSQPAGVALWGGGLGRLVCRSSAFHLLCYPLFPLLDIPVDHTSKRVLNQRPLPAWVRNSGMNWI